MEHDQKADATPIMGTPAITDRPVFGHAAEVKAVAASKRPRPSILITLAADALRLQGNAERKLKAAAECMNAGDPIRDEILTALADLAISSKSIEALNAETLKSLA